MFKKALGYTGTYKKTTYAAIIFMILGVTMSVIPFFLVYQLLLPLLGYGNLSTFSIIWHILAIGLCGILYSIFYIHGLALSHESAYHTLQNIRISLQGKLEKQPLGTIQEKGIGTIKKMFIDDIEHLEVLLAHAIPEGTSNFTVPTIIFIAMFFVDWKLALLSLCALPFGILSLGIMYRCSTDKINAYYSAAQKMNNTIVEYINGMEVVKVFNRGGDSYKRFEDDVLNYRNFTLDWYKACWPWMALYNSLFPCIALFTLPFGGWFVLKGLSTLPDLVLVICLSFSVGAPLLRALSFMGTIPQLNYKIESLEKIMADAPLKQNDQPFSGKDHTVSFDHVRFSYKDSEVLHDISLTAETGKFTALVGSSGSGKSTLAKLMVHFYDATSGNVCIGGQNVQDMSIEALNEQISYVSQEQYLFNISLMENIRLGKPSASDEEVLEAASKAQCNEFLARLENGIYTLAGDGGKQLSGGERQRISLARAILKNAPIVVLDEATAFMDPENEEKMNAAISKVIQNKTVIVIAHRLNTIINADKICVLKEGRLSSEGTHLELLKTSPEYQNLWAAAKGITDWKVSTQDATAHLEKERSRA